MRLPPVRTEHTPPIGYRHQRRGWDVGGRLWGEPSAPAPSACRRRTGWLAGVVVTLYVALALTLLGIGFWRQSPACLTIGHVIELGCREAR
jgi:hypothetical protein